MSKILAWSWSRLNDFETCPKMFWGKYIQKCFPKPDFAAEHFVKGRAVHKALEDYMKNGVVIPYPIIKDEYKFYVDLKFLLPLLNKMHEAPTKLVEEKLCFDMRMNKVGWWDKNAWVRVIMDLIVVVDDFALIIDYKTGKVKQYSDQLKLCAGTAFEIFPQVNRVLSAYLWTEHPHQKPTYAEYTRADNDDIWHSFGGRAELIQMANESGNWPAKKNLFCKWCDALPSQCDFKQCD